MNFELVEGICVCACVNVFIHPDEHPRGQQNRILTRKLQLQEQFETSSEYHDY